MDEKKKKQLVAWLNDAYSMEKQVETNLQKQIENISDPTLKQQVQQHLDQAKQQGEKVKQRIEALGEKVSSIKSGLGQVVETIQSTMDQASPDSEVKSLISDISSAHFEMATYGSIAYAANEIGDTETAQMGEQIFQEESQMAQKLEASLENTVKQFLSKQSSQASEQQSQQSAQPSQPPSIYSSGQQQSPPPEVASQVSDLNQQVSDLNQQVSDLNKKVSSS